MVPSVEQRVAGGIAALAGKQCDPLFAANLLAESRALALSDRRTAGEVLSLLG